MISKLRKFNRAILSILMTLIISAGLLGSATPIVADSTAVLEAGSVNGEAGATISIPISLTSAGDAVAVQFDLCYDSTQLTYIKTTRGNLVNLMNEEEEYIFSVDKTPISDDAGSRVRVMVYSSTNTLIASGTDTVVDMQFSVNDGVTGEQTSVLDLDGVIIGDIAGDKISTSVTDGQFSGVNVAVTGVSLDDELIINKGGSGQLTATISPDNASNKNVTWTSDLESVATVDSAGLVTGTGEGTATITVTTEDGNFQDTCAVTVNPPVAVTGITLDKTVDNISTGCFTQLTASLTPDDATNQKVNWSSDNESVAEVNSSGLVKGVSPGNAVITATTEDGGYSAACVITVDLWIWDGSSMDISWYTADPTADSFILYTPDQLKGFGFMVSASEDEWTALGLSTSNPDYGQRRFVDKTITLANDIWLNSTTGTAKGDSTQNIWTSIGGGGYNNGGVSTTQYSFGGTFDGGNHTVFNVYIDRGNYSVDTYWASNTGFFGLLAPMGIIKNLTVTGFVDADRSVGGVVGKNWGTVINCTNYCAVNNYQSKGVGGVVGANWFDTTYIPNVIPTVSNCTNYGTITTAYSTGICGGVVGDSEGVVEYCANYGTVSAANAGTANIGGVVGNIKIYNGNTEIVRYCFNAGTVEKGQWIGGVVGEAQDGIGIIYNCYNTGSVTGGGNTDYVGGILGNDRGTTVVITNCYNTGAITATSGYAGSIAGSILSASSIANCYYLSGSAAAGTGSGTDTALSRTSGEMSSVEFVSSLNGNGRAFIADTTIINLGYPILRFQTADTSTLESITKESDPAKTIYVEGQTFDASGLSIWANYSDSTREEITDYTISKTSALETTDTVITISGTHNSTPYCFEIPVTVAANVLVSITISTPPLNLLYAAGETFDTTGMVITAIFLDNSTLDLTDSDYSLDPGITTPLSVADTEIAISYTYAGNTLTTVQAITVLTSSAPGQNSNNAYEIYNPDQIVWFANQVNILSRNSINAVIMNTLDLSGVAWTPIGTGTSGYAGTFDGNNQTITLNVNAAAEYSSLFGVLNDATVKDLIIDGTVSGGQYTGGIAAYTAGTTTISNCVNNASITGTSMVGGIVGYHNSTGSINQCVNTGSVTASNTDSTAAFSVGGIAGYLNSVSTLDQCYNTGVITSSGTSTETHTGGIIGTSVSSCSVQNCYNRGTVTAENGGTCTAGVIGYAASNTGISNNYYLDTIASQGLGYTTDNTVSRTAEEMQTSQFVSDLNGDGRAFVMDSTPNINGGYPVLRFQIVDTAALVDITKESDPTQTSYYEGQLFNVTGMAIWANYSDSTREKITDYTISKTTALETTDTTITVSGTYNGTNYSFDIAITVAVNSLTDIIITTLPSKLTYSEGDLFDITGMVITAAFMDGSTVILTESDYTLSPDLSTPLTVSDSKILISYTLSGVTKTVELLIIVIESPALNSDGYYEIYTAGQMFWFASQVNGGNCGINGLVMNNIDLSCVNWTPMGGLYTSYSGIFDGNGYTLTLIIDANSDYVGLFGLMSGATVKNLTIAGSVSGRQGTGAIAGCAKSASIITDCTNNADVTSVSSYVGGVLGYGPSSSTTQLISCTNNGSVTATNTLGGVVGYWGSTGQIYQCANTGTITATSSSGEVGGIVGYIYGSATLDQCYNTGSINGGVSYLGGIAGYQRNTYAGVYNSYNSGSITSTKTSDTVKTGGVVGGTYSSSCRVQNCYNTGIINVNNTGSYTAGVVGYAAGTTNISNNYYLDSTASKGLGYSSDNTAGMTSDEMQSTAFLASLNGDSRLFTPDSGLINDGYPVLRCQIIDTSTLISITKETDPTLSYVEGETFDTSSLVIWANYSDNTTFKISDYTVSQTAALTTADTLITVSGEYEGVAYSFDFVITVKTTPSINSEGAYELVTPSDLHWFAAQVNAGNTAINGILMNDIDLTVVTWPCIGSSSQKYAGSFDGNGKIVNMQIDTSSKYIGLFGYINGASIHDLTISGSVTGNRYVGAVAGYTAGATTITNCINTAAVTGSTDSVGGIVGYLSSTGSVTDCLNQGAVSGPYYVGGIVGNLRSTALISRCGNSGAISVTSTDSSSLYSGGGIAGLVYAGSTIDQCYNKGNISGGVINIGGIAGILKNAAILLTNCYNSGRVTSTGASTDAHVGGIAGTSDSGCTLQNCYNTGELEGNNTLYTGGIIGYASDSTNISNNYYLNITTTQGMGYTTDDNTLTISKTSDELQDLAPTLGEYFRHGGLYPILVWQPDEFTVSVDGVIVGGTVTIDPPVVVSGESCQVTVTADNGYHLESLTDGLDVTDQLIDSIYTIANVTDNHTLNVTFIPDVTVSLLISEPAVFSGNFTAAVTVDSIQDFNAADFSVLYDPVLLRLDSVTPGVINSTEIPVAFSITEGRCIVVNDMNLPLSGISGSGVLAILHFHVLGDAGQNAEIVLSGGTLSNSLAVEIPGSWVNAATTIGRAEQTISFDELAVKGRYSPDFVLTAGASSGLEVSYSVSGECSVNGDQIHITGTGICTVTASQGGSDNYNAAADVTRTFMVYAAGDVDGNGEIDAVDITQTILIILCLTPGNDLDDATGDGKVNSLDISTIEIKILEAQ